MTASVFHAAHHRGDRDISFELALRPKPKKLIEWICEGRLRYNLVATVDTDNPTTAFSLTNTITQEWWKNQKVTPHFSGGGTRSTSAGDVTLIGDKKTLYAGIGYEDLPFDILTHSQVFEALDNAKDNGYDFSTTQPMKVAIDLVEKNSDLEDRDAMMLIVHIIMWQKWMERSPK